MISTMALCTAEAALPQMISKGYLAAIIIVTSSSTFKLTALSTVLVFLPTSEAVHQITDCHQYSRHSHLSRLHRVCSSTSPCTLQRSLLRTSVGTTISLHEDCHFACRLVTFNLRWMVQISLRCALPPPPYSC